MSNSDHPSTSIIKSDRTGRTRYTRHYKQEVLAAFDSSSLSAPQFAAQCGVKYPTFASWIAAAMRDGKPSATVTGGPTFLLAEVAAAPGAHSLALEVRLPGGAVALVPSRDQLPLLVELIRQLA